MARLFSAFKTPFLSATRFYQRLRLDSEKVDITVADWDTIVILDACRYDMFEHLNTLPGTLEPRMSIGSATNEFVDATFGDSTYDDIVYVTANPRVNVSLSGSFHAIVNVWADGWDDEFQTVPPETVADATLRAMERYPNKRIISHFIQPHAPFIGEFAHEHLDDHSTLSDHRPDVDGDDPSVENVWTRLRKGDLDVETVRRAYNENLELALPHVERILDAEPGKTVVTSDHGNLLGERIAPFMRRFYGHPSGFHAPQLLRVPWLEHSNGDRRDIVAESPAVDNDSELGEDVEEKLQNLGYV